MILILAVLAALQSPGDTALASFVARARAGTDALRHPDAARLAGYHPVGPDFPGMGRSFEQDHRLPFVGRLLDSPFHEFVALL